MSLSLFSSLDAFRAYFRKCFEQKINDLLIGFRVIKHCFRLGSDNEDDEDDQGFESRAKHDAKDEAGRSVAERVVNLGPPTNDRRKKQTSSKGVLIKLCVDLI